MTKKILAVSPHSDDAELGLGGYMHREGRIAGAETTVVVLAHGAFSSSKGGGQKVTSFTRKSEGEAAGARLGVHSYQFLEVAPDSAFGTMPAGALVAALEKVIFGEAWDEVFIPLPSFHADHTATYEASIAALRPHLNRVFPGRVYAYEYPGQAWGPPPPAVGRTYAAIADCDLDAKLEALSRHRSQWASHEQSLYGHRGVKALAELRGAEIGEPSAELFYLLRTVL